MTKLFSSISNDNFFPKFTIFQKKEKKKQRNQFAVVSKFYSGDKHTPTQTNSGIEFLFILFGYFKIYFANK